MSVAPPPVAGDASRGRWSPARLALRLAGVALVGAAGYYFLRTVDWRQALAAMAGASLPLVVLAAVLNLVQVLWRSLSFKAMLSPVRTVGTARLCRYNLAMYAANNLLPARAGELVRIYLLKVREGVPVSSTVAVALVEKVFDAIALLLLVAPLPWLAPTLPRSVSRAMWLLGGVGVAVLVATAIVSRVGARASGRVGAFARGAASVRRAGPFSAALALALVAYATDGVQVALCMAAVGIHVNLAAPALVLLAVAVALAVPSTPSGIGAMEIGAVAALHVLGVPPERALAFGVIYHATQAIPVTLLGLDGIRMASVARASMRAGAAERGLAAPRMEPDGGARSRA